MEEKEKPLRLDDLTESDTDEVASKYDASFFVKLFNQHRVSLALILIGVILIGSGVFYLKLQDTAKSDELVVLEDPSTGLGENEVIFVEIAGAVKKPGVYEFKKGDRVHDLLEVSGGISGEADKDWVERSVNRASLLSDGQKLYIPRIDEQTEGLTANQEALYQNDTSVLGSEGSTIVNINTASQSELEELWGIGPVYAQKIIEQRPYSSIEELLEKGVIKSNVYERNKDLISVY